MHDAGTLLGARSLMPPFSALRRDAPILAIFDGSSQLQKDELWRHAATWRAELAEATEPAPFDPWRDDDAVTALSPRTIGVEGAETIREAARGARGRPVAERFAISEAAAALYGLAALEELGAPGIFVTHARWLLRGPLATMGVAVTETREPWEGTEPGWEALVG